MWLTGVLTLVALAWLVMGVARGTGRSEDTPRRILDERFARGDIDRDEYGERLAALQRR
ncbi:MAG TPA: SHOCT domain-containing protein [Acidimicrobiia bacterium]|nr:SHOCT domain-containing protein [Acidimicrobiia bacterium]HLE39485.1 SHOCT domain-containing protein [Acidimicrobiia bacterium]